MSNKLYIEPNTLSKSHAAINAQIFQAISAEYLINKLANYSIIKNKAMLAFSQLNPMDAMIQLRESFPNDLETLAKVLADLYQKGFIAK